MYKQYKQGRYIKAASVKELAEKFYDENDRGITFEEIIKHFDVKKPKAQRTLKHLHKRKVLFTAQDLDKEGIHINRIKRQRPQRYFSTGSKSKIIERSTNNVLKDTTDYMASKIGIQKVQSFRELLTQLALCLLYIHKLQIKTSIPKENYDLLNWLSKGTAKAITERIGIHTIEFVLQPTGTVMIYVSSSSKPFRLHTEQDVSDIKYFLGRVDDRLRSLVSDVRDNVVPPVKEWILKGCDVNKDVETESVAQITLPDIHIPLFEKTLRGYVKQIEDRVFYRVELGLAPNLPVREALEKMRKEVVIDENVFLL